MKKLFLISALLIFACSSDLFAQDYMKMRKKQLRIEHQKKLNLIDSLSQELNLSNKENLKIKSDSKVTNLEAELKGRLVSRNNFDIIARWEGAWIPTVENCDLDSKSFVSIVKTSSEVDEDSFWKKNTWYLSGYEEYYLISGIAITKNSLEITTSSLQHYGGIVKSEKVIVFGISNSGELIHRQFGKLSNCSN